MILPKYDRTRSIPEDNYLAIFKDGKTTRLNTSLVKDIPPLRYPEIEDVSLTDKCYGGCSFCFLPGTLIKTKKGSITIESIEIGQKVLVWNGATVIERPVEQLHKRDIDEDIYVIEFEDGTQISCTGNHTIQTTKGEIKAEHLQVRDIVLSLKCKDI